jgi:hypothetical protein
MTSAELIAIERRLESAASFLQAPDAESNRHARGELRSALNLLETLRRRVDGTGRRAGDTEPVTFYGGLVVESAAAATELPLIAARPVCACFDGMCRCEVIDGVTANGSRCKAHMQDGLFPGSAQ